MNTVYFDNSATTKTDDEVIQAMLPYLTENYGNPSSIYKLGRENRKAVEEAREKVAKALNCEVNKIYFTAGGSESDNTAIRGIACTSGSLDPSHVLLAIGVPHEIAHGSLRISIGKYNTKEEVDYLVENLVEIVNRLREMSPLWEKFIEEKNANNQAL